ncbi:MAG: DUF4405 domain-containing protein [Chitinophagaceae bacterium]
MRKNKNLISLIVAGAFLFLSISGILMWLKQKSHQVEMTHTIFGLLFLSIAIFHIVNNWGSLKAYSKDKNTGSIKKELIISSLITIVILVLAFTEVLEPVAEFGRRFAKPQGPRPAAGISFNEATTLDSTNGQAVTLVLQKKEEAMSGQLTVEVADTTGKILETLYASNAEQKGPASNLILNSKISTAVPFKLIVKSTIAQLSEEEEEEAREGKKVEPKNVKTISQEVLISNLTPGFQNIVSGENTPLKRGILEVK